MIINTDGGARGNPGPGACAAIIKDRNGNTIYKVGKFLGYCTNNEAEYCGLILGLQAAIKLGSQEQEVEVNMDSELVVKQLKGLYKVKEPRLAKLYIKAKALEQKLGTVRYFAVRREKNKEADALVNLVLNKHTCP